MAPIQLVEIKRLGATLLALRPVSYKRRFAAALRADLEGYSRMMGLDEEGTHRAVDGLIRQLRDTIRTFGGRITNVAGDGLTAEFTSSTTALKFAVEIQALADRMNRERSQDLQLRFRIGIHQGDVIVGDKDIFGDTVNIAARLEAMAPPRAICFSQPVYEQIKGDIPGQYCFLGRRWLKNIRQPIEAWLLLPGEAAATPPGPGLADGLLGAWEAPEPTLRSPGLQLIAAASNRSAGGRPVVAVLSFRNLDAQQGNSHLVEGLADDLATSLANFRELLVVSRRITAVYGSLPDELAELRQTFGVDYAVHGSMLTAGSKLRVNIHLSETATGRQIWATRQDLEFGEVFAALEGLVAKVMAAVAPTVELDRREQARGKAPETLQAYDCYLRGKQLLYAAPNREQAEQARQYLERAIELDREFILPYGHLARLYNTDMVGTIAGGPLEQNRARAFDLAKRALAIDPASPLAHFSAGWCNLWRHEFKRARFHFDRVVALNPYDPHRLTDVATGLMYLGDHEGALGAMQRAIELNPFHSEDYLADLAEIFFVMERYDDALELYDLVTHSTPKRRAWRTAAFAWARRSAEARGEAAGLVDHVRSIWVGDPFAGLSEILKWLFAHYPFAKADDEARFRTGLRVAGLPA